MYKIHSIIVTKLDSIIEENGILSVIDNEVLPFEPKRIFYVSGVPQYEIRGKHAHYKTEQVLICLQGLIQVVLDDSRNEYQFLLCPHECLYIPNMIWDSQQYLTGNDILMSICSTLYDKSDYIEDFKLFVEMVRKS